MNKKRARTSLLVWALLAVPLALFGASSAPQVKTGSGMVEGREDGEVRVFLGIPYAASPVGDLRWKPPSATAKWTGVRKATEFGTHCMQGKVFGDMNFQIWNSVRRLAGGRSALEAPLSHGEMDRGTQGHGVRYALYAGKSVWRHELSRCRRQRGLPVSERMGSGENLSGEAAGDGLDLWRRLRRGVGFRGAAGWRSSAAAGRDRGEHELSVGSFRIFCASGTCEGVGAECCRQLRLARSGGCAAVGT